MDAEGRLLALRAGAKNRRDPAADDATLGLLLARLRAEYGNRDVYLSVVAGNEAAARLYASFGFVQTGEKDVGGEEVYVRRAEEMLPPS